MAMHTFIFAACVASLVGAVRMSEGEEVDLLDDTQDAQDATIPRIFGGQKCKERVPGALPSRFSILRIRRCKCPAGQALAGENKKACGDGTRTLFMEDTVKGQGCSCQPLMACPAVTTQPNFNFTEYISKRWYVQEQMLITYLPATANNCVTAKYTLKESNTFWGYSITVGNRAKNDDGSSRGIDLCADSADKNDPAKLKVSLCLLPKLFSGPYWILAHNEAEGYAIISGGQPKIKTTNGCRTGTGTNGSGLWIITREIDPPAELLGKVKGMAADMGFDVGVLVPVSHSDCAGIEGYGPVGNSTQSEQS